MYYKPTKLMKIVGAIFEKRNFFFPCMILRVDRKPKNGQEIFAKRTPDIEFQQYWSVGLIATLGDGQKFKNYFSTFRDFFEKKKSR